MTVVKRLQARGSQIRILAVLAMFLFGGIAASSAAGSGTNWYCGGKFLQPGAGCNNGVYHNYEWNRITINGGASTSDPTGLFFKTQAGTKFGVLDGFGTLTVQVSGIYYAAGTCWNRSSIYTLYVDTCLDTW